MNQSILHRGLLSGIVLFCSLAMAQKADPFAKIKPVEEKFTPIAFGDIQPGGWIKKQIQENLDGFTGRLDSLVPSLIVEDDIYGKDRLTKKVKNKDVGALGEDGDWQVQFLWWNSETQSNWWDGYIRSAILVNDKKHLARVENYVAQILTTQDKDGYLGIYDDELRYNFDNENGELWAKASLLRGLLAWYDYTKDEKVFTAVKRAVDNVMVNWPAETAKPFYSVNPNVGGLSHGLVFTDVLEDIYLKTGNRKYLDYALYLYKDFSVHELNEDAQFKKLIDKSVMLTGHGVHTYEHLRVVALAYYVSGNPEIKKALDNFLEKIETETTASGGPVGDEWILGKRADATGRGYEYCSLQELLHSYASLYIKSGKSSYGDDIEHLFFNAAEGARHPEESSIAYLKSDNSYEMTGGLNGDKSVETQTRFKYSPVHQDAAVCCVPNAGRIAPYYVQHMWLKGNNSIIASLLGPGKLETTVKDKKVIITEVTDYPYNNIIKFEISGNSASFDLKIRKPSWVKKFKVSEKYTEKDGFIIISKNWKGKQVVTVEFDPEVEVRQDINGEYYFTYGALVLANPINAKGTEVKFYPLKGYSDKHYIPNDLVIYQYKGEKVKQKGNNLIFETKLYNPDTGKYETVNLKPMGETILRQVTFKK